MITLRVGVVGYSGQSFDTIAARQLLELSVERILTDHPDVESLEIVSGLTNVGIPALAYQIASEKGYSTVGVACEKAKRYECFPVNREIIVGSEWGDESEVFLSEVDVIVRIGGGKQSLAEVECFRSTGGAVYEYELEAVPASS